MSGHNKWSTIKHKKGRVDAMKSRRWTKLVKEITVAARLGGGDPGGNPRLRLAIDNARADNMPSDNIERAIKKGTGDLQGVQYEDITYEAYGPEGVALLIDTTTDNRNRTISEVRAVFNKNNGKMAESGAVAWMFETRGYIAVDGDGVDEDALFMTVTEAGADDMQREDDAFEVYTVLHSFEAVRQAVLAAGFKVTEAKITKIPTTTVKLEGKSAEQAMRLVELLEDNDDVREVYSNFEIDEDELERLTA